MRIRLTRLASGNSANTLPIKGNDGESAIELIATPKIGYVGLTDGQGNPRVYIEIESEIHGYGALCGVIDILRSELDDLLAVNDKADKCPAHVKVVRDAFKQYMDGAINIFEFIQNALNSANQDATSPEVTQALVDAYKAVDTAMSIVQIDNANADNAARN